MSRTVLVACLAWLAIPGAAPGQNIPELLDSMQRGADGDAIPTADELRGVTVPAELDQGVALLGDPSYAVREEATAKLVEGAFRKEEVYAVLAQRSLSAEQRHRLLEVLHDRLIRMPRGAVGISMDQRFLPSRIVVMDLIPGLPACEVLQVGDRIVSLQGKELKTQMEFVKTVQSQPPGTKITLRVERLVPADRRGENAAAVEPQFEVLDIDIVLGSAELLRDPDGRPTQNNSLLEDRKRQADEAQRLYGPRPKLIEVR